MKYSSEIVIDRPLSKVIELFDNQDNLKEWMEGLISFEPISGEPGQVGAKSGLKFKTDRGEMEMIETVTVRNLPKEFTGTYEAKGVFNIVKNIFIPISETKTKYITEQEFQFQGFMKIIGFLMPGAFKKQSMKYLVAFKEFVERTA